METINIEDVEKVLGYLCRVNGKYRYSVPDMDEGECYTVVLLGVSPTGKMIWKCTCGSNGMCRHKKRVISVNSRLDKLFG